VNIPEDTFTVPIPVPPPGEDYMARLQCCQSEITRVIPAGSTEAEIEAVVNQMFVECAQQQALCDAETEFPTSPVVFGNVVVYFSMDCAVDTTITFSGSLPSGVSLDTAGSRVVLAAGVIAGFTQAEADAAAQSFLNGFCEASIIAGTLTCEAASSGIEFAVNLFFINCFAGNLEFESVTLCPAGSPPPTTLNGYTFTIQRTSTGPFTGGLSFNGNMTAIYTGPPTTLYYHYDKSAPNVQVGGYATLWVNGVPIISLDTTTTLVSETYPFAVNTGDTIFLEAGIDTDENAGSSYTETILIDENP
jgi:hypothetical protein